MTDDEEESKELTPEQVFDQHTETAAVLARLDERTQRTNELVERLLDERVAPLEEQVERLDNRTRRNQLIISAAVTLFTIVGTWALGLIPV